MTDRSDQKRDFTDLEDAAPGAEETNQHEAGGGLKAYVIGYGLALLLTAASFIVIRGDLVYPPALVSALVVLAVAQMGVHLVFFLHLTTGPDNTNNTLALVFGIFVVVLLVVGSIWIMHHLNHNTQMQEMTPPF